MRSTVFSLLLWISSSHLSSSGVDAARLLLSKGDSPRGSCSSPYILHDRDDVHLLADEHTCDNENSFELLYTGSGANPLLSKDFVMQLPASPEPRQITVQTLPTVGEESFDTWLWVSTKCGLDVNIGETVAQNDDFGDSSLSLVSFTAEPDQDYFISVEGYDGACGTIQVQVEVDQLLLEESPAHLPKEGSPILAIDPPNSAGKYGPLYIESCPTGSVVTSVSGFGGDLLDAMLSIGCSDGTVLNGLPQLRDANFEFTCAQGFSGFKARVTGGHYEGRLLAWASWLCGDTWTEPVSQFDDISDTVYPIGTTMCLPGSPGLLDIGAKYTKVNDVDYIGYLSFSCGAPVEFSGSCSAPYIILDREYTLVAGNTCDNENSFQVLFEGSGSDLLMSKDFVMQLPASPSERQITVQTLPDGGGEEFDTQLWVSTKCGLDVKFSDDETVTDNDDFGDSTLSLVSFTAEADQDYFISVEGFEGACGPIKVQVKVDQLPREESAAPLPKQDNGKPPKR